MCCKHCSEGPQRIFENNSSSYIRNRFKRDADPSKTYHWTWAENRDVTKSEVMSSDVKGEKTDSSSLWFGKRWSPQKHFMQDVLYIKAYNIIQKHTVWLASAICRCFFRAIKTCRGLINLSPVRDFALVISDTQSTLKSITESGFVNSYHEVHLFPLSFHLS